MRLHSQRRRLRLWWREGGWGRNRRVKGLDGEREWGRYSLRMHQGGRSLRRGRFCECSSEILVVEELNPWCWIYLIRVAEKFGFWDWEEEEDSLWIVIVVSYELGRSEWVYVERDLNGRIFQIWPLRVYRSEGQITGQSWCCVTASVLLFLFVQNKTGRPNGPRWVLVCPRQGHFYPELGYVIIRKQT